MQEKFKVNDMSCEKCVSKITNFMGSLDGVSDVKVDLAQKEVVLELSELGESTLSRDALKEALLDLGYEDIA